jgi:hypothetical protein
LARHHALKSGSVVTAAGTIGPTDSTEENDATGATAMKSASAS